MKKLLFLFLFLHCVVFAQTAGVTISKSSSGTIVSGTSYTVNSNSIFRIQTTTSNLVFTVPSPAAGTFPEINIFNDSIANSKTFTVVPGGNLAPSNGLVLRWNGTKWNVQSKSGIGGKIYDDVTLDQNSNGFIIKNGSATVADFKNGYYNRSNGSNLLRNGIVYDEDGDVSILFDTDSRALYDKNNNRPTVLYEVEQLRNAYEGDGKVSLDWYYRTALNSAQQTVIDYENGYYNDEAGRKMLRNHQLWTTTNEMTGDFENGTLNDYSGQRSISWLANGNDRELITHNDITALKWYNGVGVNSQITAKYANLRTTNLTSDRTFEFPDATGTIALTSSNVASATALQTARYINGKAFDGTADITIPTIPANTIVLIGDSWTGLHKGGVSPGVTTPCNGYWNIANTRMNKKFHVLNYAGVAGERTDQIAARFSAEVLALTPGWVAIQGGINDVNQSVSATTIFNNLKGMYDLAISKGIRPIVFTIPLVPVFGNATLRNVAHQVNALLKQDIRSKQNIILIDGNNVLVDQSTGLVASAYIQADNTHLTNLGAGVFGDFIYQRLDGAIANQIDMLPSSSNDNYTNFGTGGDYTNLLPNGLLTGNSSGLATNWATNVTLSVGGSGVLNTDFQQSKVSAFSTANRNYRNYEYQQLKAIGSTSTEKRFAYRVSSVSSITGFNVGDYYYAECEFEADDDWVNVTRMSLELVSTTASFTPSTASIDLFNDTSYGTHTGSTTPQYNIKSGTLRTYPIQVVSGRDRLYSEFKFYAGNGTVRIARMAIKKAIPYTVGGVTYFLY